MNKTTIGLKERIQRAETLAEIDTLLQQGATFQMASLATRRSWENAASKRRYQLNNDTRISA